MQMLLMPNNIWKNTKTLGILDISLFSDKRIACAKFSWSIASDINSSACSIFIILEKSFTEKLVQNFPLISVKNVN